MVVRAGSSTNIRDPLGFTLPLAELRNDILIPKYYDPEIDLEAKRLRATHQLVSIDELEAQKVVSLKQGNEIGKMAYGTGTIPFIRTSDIINWELRFDPKQGVSEDVYQAYRANQDVRADDILLVRDGTYLIGSACLIHRSNTKILYQSHITKIRCENPTKLSPFLLLALLGTSFVQKQIRSKQFTSDIIDTLGHRIREILLPIPSPDIAKDIQKRTRTIVETRANFQTTMRQVIFDLEGVEAPRVMRESESPDDRALGFTLPIGQAVDSILIPKYYDPGIRADLQRLGKTHDLVSLGELRAQGTISVRTGDEIGKMAYGTGHIPFIRTSDISNWELKTDPKQGVSEEIYYTYARKQDIAALDILVVRDGTYLVGTSCLLTEQDTKVLYCGGIFKIRVKPNREINPFLVLALLNTPMVRRQVKAKQFTRDVIDTLGNRFYEVILPVPKSSATLASITRTVSRLVERKMALRSEQEKITTDIITPTED